MADADDVRRLALALPHVVEIESDGFDFRVADKGFVWSYPERRPGRSRIIRTDIAVLFVGDEAEKQALLLGEPDAFFTAPAYDGTPLVLLRLARVDVERLTELVAGGWASAFTTANRTNAAAANDNRRGAIFRFVGMLLLHFHCVARGARFEQIPAAHCSCRCRAMLVELCRSAASIASRLECANSR